MGCLKAIPVSNTSFFENREIARQRFRVVLPDWVRCKTAVSPMSQMGHQRQIADVRHESGSPPIAPELRIAAATDWRRTWRDAHPFRGL
jgi:hypothetical protein